MQLRLSLTILIGFALVGCGGGAGSSSGAIQAPQNAPTVFVAGVSHTYFPLEPGMRWVYEGTHNGMTRREDVRTLDTPREIAGVACAAILEEVFDDGVLTELTTEWFAQDADGNVWKFGEESFVLAGASLVRAPDSWVAGENGFLPWRAFVADPQPGDEFFGFTPEGQDLLRVVSVTEMAVVPAGTFPGSMQIIENPDDPSDTDILLYARGVGRVSETNTNGGVRLISVQGR